MHGYDTAPSPLTLLALERFASIMGMDAMHVAGGYSLLRPDIGDVLMEFDYQDPNKISRTAISQAIENAEHDLANFLAYWPGARWINEEEVEYPDHYRHETRARGVTLRGDYKRITTYWGHIIQGGKRATARIPAPTVTRLADLDTDGDGFPEQARFQITGLPATTDLCEIKAYFKVFAVGDEVNCRTDVSSTGADPFWEVRPLYARWSGANALVTVTVWNLFRPRLRFADNAAPIDANAGASYVDTLEFYLETNDPSEQVEFMWGSQAACDAIPPGSYATQSGVMQIIDKRAGIVELKPATWNATTQLFEAAEWAYATEPDKVKMYYRSGFYPELPWGCRLVNDFWAQNIAILAAARLEISLCTCQPAQSRLNYWQDDLISTEKSNLFSFGTEVALGNPFGSRRGEVYVYNRCKGRGLRRGKVIYV